jgi:hypothetical protein
VVALEILAYFLDNIVAVGAAIVVAAAIVDASGVVVLVVVDAFDIVVADGLEAVAVAVETYHY